MATRARVTIDDTLAASILASTRALGWHAYAELEHASGFPPLRTPPSGGHIESGLLSRLFEECARTILSGAVIAAQDPDPENNVTSRDVRDSVLLPDSVVFRNSSAYDSPSAQWFADHPKRFALDHDPTGAEEIVFASEAASRELLAEEDAPALGMATDIRAALADLTELAGRKFEPRG